MTDTAWAATHIDNAEASCTLEYSSSSSYTLSTLSTQCGSHFLVAPSQNALFNYGKPEMAVVEKGNTVIWRELGGEAGDLGQQGAVWTWQPRAWIVWMDFKADDLHADLMICAFQSCVNVSFLFLIFLSSFGLFFSPPRIEITPPSLTPPSHDTARGIILGYVQRSMLTFNPGLWDRRGPRPLPEHKEWRGQRRYCWRGLLTDRSFFTHCFFFQTAILSCKVTPWQPWKV